MLGPIYSQDSWFDVQPLQLDSHFLGFRSAVLTQFVIHNEACEGWTLTFGFSYFTTQASQCHGIYAAADGQA